MQTPIKTAYKTLLLALVSVLLGLVSSGARAQPYNATVNGTNYDFTYVTGTFNDNADLLQSQPWWNGLSTGDASTATTFATAVGGSLGYPNCFWGCTGPVFASGYSPASGITVYGATIQQGGGIYTGSQVFNTWSWRYAVATPTSSGAVPEMNASLIPQVGLLLGCLFLLMGRKKEFTEPMLAA
jgi:hypothetical protein